MNENRTLKLTSPMMHGSAVRRLQEFGDLLGFDFGPNDGIFGHDTERVVRELQAHLGLKVDGICGPLTWQAVLDAVDLEVGGDELPEGIVDLRGTHPKPKWYKCPRPWVDIEGVTLHQTGCDMPRRPEGWCRLNAHLGITQEGCLILVNDLTDWIWHAQGFSKKTVGIEIEGNYPGLEDDLSTLWKGGGGPHCLNEEMMSALSKAFEWLQGEFAEQHAAWRLVVGHRQSKGSRIADPGEEIWKAVGIPWQRALGATDGGPHYCKGDGRPIPQDWNEAYSASYRGR